MNYHKSTLSVAVGFGLAALFFNPAAAWAQGNPPPPPSTESGNIEKSLNKEKEKPPKEQPKVGVQDRPEMKTGDDTKIKIKVTRFNVTGAQSFTADQLHALVADAEGKEHTLAEIKAVAGRITMHYRQNGYSLAFAYVPAQDIKEGVVEISCVEGKIDKILVGGNNHYSAEFIIRHLQVSSGDAATSIEDLEKGLMALNEYPGLKVGATLRPGETTGSTDLYLNVEDRFPLTLSVDYDNYGSEFVSRSRIGATIEAFNLFDLGHWLTLRAVTGIPIEALTFSRVMYTIPFRSQIKINAFWSHYEYNAQQGIDILDPNGTGDVYGVNGSIAFFRSRQTLFTATLGIEFKDLEQKLGDLQTSSDKLRTIVAGVEWNHTDEYWGRTMVNFEFRQGLAGFAGGLEDNDPDASRLRSGGGYTKMTLQLYRLQKAFDWMHFIFRAQAQWSEEALVVSEQYSLGGPDTVRGYPNFEFMGDRGWNMSLEMRVTPAVLLSMVEADETVMMIAEMIQVAAFIDFGEAMLVRPTLGQDRERSLSGAGVGLRVQYNPYVTLRYDVGFNVSKYDPSKGESPVHYLSVIVTIH
jgi:hemolysin activation/secretion protein